MKKGMTALLSILLLATLLIGCSNDAKSSSQGLGYVTFGDGSSRGLSSTLSEAPGLDQLRWTYKATKTDNGFTTGTTDNSSLTFNADGTSSQVGPFSVGAWNSH